MIKLYVRTTAKNVEQIVPGKIKFIYRVLFGHLYHVTDATEEELTLILTMLNDEIVDIIEYP